MHCEFCGDSSDSSLAQPLYGPLCVLPKPAAAKAWPVLSMGAFICSNILCALSFYQADHGGVNMQFMQLQGKMVAFLLQLYGPWDSTVVLTSPLYVGHP